MSDARMDFYEPKAVCKAHMAVKSNGRRAEKRALAPITLSGRFSIWEFSDADGQMGVPSQITTPRRLDGDLRFHMHQYHSSSGQKNDSFLWVLRLAAGCPPPQNACMTFVKYTDVLGHHPGAEEPFDNQDAEEGET
jgi:hypothetical protein